MRETITRYNPRAITEGDRLTVTETTGYTLVQNRPMDCQNYGEYPTGGYGWGCKCGRCDGVTTEYPGTVTKVIHYADNSIEAEVACDDGKTRRKTLIAPHGDVC